MQPRISRKFNHVFGYYFYSLYFTIFIPLTLTTQSYFICIYIFWAAAKWNVFLATIIFLLVYWSVLFLSLALSLGRTWWSNCSVLGVLFFASNSIYYIFYCIFFILPLCVCEPYVFGQMLFNRPFHFHFTHILAQIAIVQHFIFGGNLNEEFISLPRHVKYEWE